MTEQYIYDTLNSIIQSTDNKFNDTWGIRCMRLTVEEKDLVIHVHKLLCNGSTEIKASELFIKLSIKESDFWTLILEMVDKADHMLNIKLNYFPYN